jgi:hypothetical protein
VQPASLSNCLRSFSGACVTRLPSHGSVLQKYAVSLPTSDLLLPLAMKSGFIAIDTRHSEILSVGPLKPRPVSQQITGDRPESAADGSLCSTP